MAEYLTLANGDLVPMHAVSLLRSLGWDKRGSKRYAVIDLAGDVIGEINDDNVKPGTIISAAPGWLMGYVYYPEPGGPEVVEIFTECIVAWRISSTLGASPDPILVTGDACAQPTVIVAPDGRVEDYSTDYPNLDAAKAGLLASWRESEQRKAAKSA